MTIAIPVKTLSINPTIASLFANAKFFAYSRDGELGIEKMEEERGRDVARTLIAQNIDILITSQLGFKPFVLLKSYGIQIYFAGVEELTAADLLNQFHAGALVEVTPENFGTLLD
ncbi:MAG: NifB/NifX family molybdenum-iron cluster-binding protein [Sulfuricurvum sp.]|jgi:predicted Fe-Mo cluster-binding NifX family protein|uniref:NifB/NifX family molybdenum-iron cluster-binding protein n=1 Tax=Sulfuricurvum sp. TaxID=2025608 RepID=UPI0035654B61